MQAFGLTYGGALTDQEIRAIVDFIAVLVRAAGRGGAGGKSRGGAAAITDPGFAKDVKPILDKRCASCHGRRPKGDYSVADYNEVMTSGDNAPVIIAGDAANSTLVKMLHGIKTDAGGQMPPVAR